VSTARADAVVVGLGAAGGLVAAELALGGLHVVGLDKGPGHTDADFRYKQDEIKYYVRGAGIPGRGPDPITWRPDEGARAVPLPWATEVYPLADPLHLPPAGGTGGGSVRWTAAAWRFREADFRMRGAIAERFGASALPEDCTLADWPIGYRDLEPYYDRVEWELGVSGRAGNVGGRILAGGNPFESPRRRGYPLPPLRRGTADGRFVDASRRLGYHPFPQPAAIASAAYAGRAACTYCGHCHGYPCHVGAKASTNLISLPAAVASGNLDVRPYARATRVFRDPAGRVSGVSYIDVMGRAMDVATEIVVLACYTLENTRLLLLSGIDGSGHTGRHYMTHNYGDLRGVLPEWTNPFMGPQVAGSVIDDVTSELIPDNDAGVVWGSPIIGEGGDIQPIEAAHMRPASVPRWGRALKDWLRESYRHLYQMCSQTTSLPSARAYCDLDPAVRDALGLPALRITHEWSDYDRQAAKYMMGVKRRLAAEMGMTHWWEAPAAPRYHVSNHEAGTYRMGEDPRSSVADRAGQCHQCAGLYLTGGGLFPSYGSYNPTETIQALALWTADHILRGEAAGPSR
jgi:gluconate 2-dehydrogenase alpha chain